MPEDSPNLPQPVTVLRPAQQTALINILRRAAKAEILPRFRNMSSAQISAKSSPTDLVTEADTAAEASIARGILGLFPNAVILGEEAAAKDPELRDRAAKAELAFIIDPVDGTWNYAHGLGAFGVILAATRFGVPIWGAIYDPLADDWVMADETGPAVMQRAGRAARVLTLTPAGGFETLSGYAHVTLLPKDRQEAIAPLLPAFHRVGSLRCSAHEYRLFAQGAGDFVLSGTLTPWDHAAGVLIAARAGGVSRFTDGRTYDISINDGYLLTARDEDSWQRLKDHFAPALHQG